MSEAQFQSLFGVVWLSAAFAARGAGDRFAGWICLIMAIGSQVLALV